MVGELSRNIVTLIILIFPQIKNICFNPVETGGFRGDAGWIELNPRLD